MTRKEILISAKELASGIGSEHQLRQFIRENISRETVYNYRLCFESIGFLWFWKPSAVLPEVYYEKPKEGSYDQSFHGKKLDVLFNAMDDEDAVNLLTVLLFYEIRISVAQDEIGADYLKFEI